MTPPRGGSWGAFALAGILAFGLLLGAFFIQRFAGDDAALFQRTESGLIEVGTAVLYGLALVLALSIALVKKWRSGFFAALAILAMLLRELDFHARFSDEKMSSTRYWRSAEEPLPGKLLAFVILLCLSLAIFHWLWSKRPAFIRDLRDGLAYPATVLAILGYGLLSMLLDKWTDTDALDQPIHLFMSLGEECIELGIPFLIIVALIQWSRRPSPRDSAMR